MFCDVLSVVINVAQFFYGVLFLFDLIALVWCEVCGTSLYCGMM